MISFFNKHTLFIHMFLYKITFVGEILSAAYFSACFIAFSKQLKFAADSLKVSEFLEDMEGSGNNESDLPNT